MDVSLDLLEAVLNFEEFALELVTGRFFDFLCGLGKLGLNLVVLSGQVVGLRLDILYVCVVLLLEFCEVFSLCLVARGGLCWPLCVLKFGEVVRDSLNLFD